jgi:hypothetical protein
MYTWLVSGKRPVQFIALAALQDVFTRATMHDYVWLLGTPTEDPDNDAPAIEAGISDAQLDKQMAANGGMCPIVQLSKEDLRSQIQLLPQGLLGRGMRPARSIVFQYC